MPDLFKDVGDFHKKFDLPHFPSQPILLDPSTRAFRQNFMQEELNEFDQACKECNIYQAADALADLVYVALGTAHMMGLPFDEIWAEVQRANMSKERATGADDPRSKRANALDVIKPEGWTAPDHRPAINKCIDV